MGNSMKEKPADVLECTHNEFRYSMSLSATKTSSGFCSEDTNNDSSSDLPNSPYDLITK